MEQSSCRRTIINDFAISSSRDVSGMLRWLQRNRACNVVEGAALLQPGNRVVRSAWSCSTIGTRAASFSVQTAERARHALAMVANITI
jgi:hypothetical protein